MPTYTSLEPYARAVYDLAIYVEQDVRDDDYDDPDMTTAIARLRNALHADPTSEETYDAAHALEALVADIVGSDVDLPAFDEGP